ncbi:Hypothetical protein I595_75 [Croceitalea dokdonensis DOKDO 023]|uniref:Uncharacterized protein n=1 Tax=Croceitalea dokdonensis DOKDO 023 TaxID=1300341 RepID=A0A0P7B1U2_9FLAO|nr:hypothetical protein [Croceitalea dokdonensis]KPM33173.1 Hypothetical protein I595_75 [Croceitalea dokdonensis DOKDO 023]
MKTVLTFVLIIFTATTAMASTGQKEMKVAALSYGVTLDIKIEKTSKIENSTARLYMFKNSRIKKALSFKTKRNKAVMA